VMRAEDRRTALALAFRETALSLIGLFQIYEVEPEVADAAAEVLGKLFRRHLDPPPERCGRERCRPMHALVDELDRVLGGAR